MILIFLLMDTSDSVLKHQVLFLLTCYINWSDVFDLADPDEQCKPGEKCKPGYECINDICSANSKYSGCYILPETLLSIQLQEQGKYNCC